MLQPRHAYYQRRSIASTWGGPAHVREGKVGESSATMFYADRSGTTTVYN